MFITLYISGIDPFLNDYIELSNGVHDDVDDATTGTEKNVDNDEVKVYQQVKVPYRSSLCR